MFRELVQEFCLDLQVLLNHNLKVDGGTPNSVISFVVEEKPADYFVPDIPVGVVTERGLRLYAELYIDQVCVFRESVVDGDEEELCRRLLYNIFCEGMGNSYSVVIRRGLS